MILDAFKFTNNLFSNHFSKFLTVVFPVYVIIFFVYLQMSSIPGNEFGTTTALNYQELVINLLTVYAVILSILLNKYWLLLTVSLPPWAASRGTGCISARQPQAVFF